MVAVPTSHELADAQSVSMADLKEQPFITYAPSHGSQVREAMMRLADQAGYLPHIAQEAPDPYSLLALVGHAGRDRDRRRVLRITIRIDGVTYFSLRRRGWGCVDDWRSVGAATEFLEGSGSGRRDRCRRSCPRRVRVEVMEMPIDDKAYAAKMRGFCRCSTDLEVDVRFIDMIVDRESRVLDIGCGIGNAVNGLQARGHDAFGIDPSSEVFRVSRGTLRPFVVPVDEHHQNLG